ACVLLFVTSGISLTRMTCLMSGRTTVSLGALNDCCADDGSGGASLETQCCLIVQASMPQVHVVLSKSVTPSIVVAPFVFAPPAVLLTATARSVRLDHDRPPPLLPGDRLARLRTLRV
ncbi:MAG TPA: hypothetical protein PK760_16115, partial [Flavobacteriales bacterium]|nr:hypothetical protein [Flavobacteriales bacterium]